MRLGHSTETKALAKAKAHGKSGPPGEQQERALETNPGNYLSAKARERDLEKPETNRGAWLNIRKVPMREQDQGKLEITGIWLSAIGRAPEQVTPGQDKPGQTQTSTRQEINSTGETWAETRRKCTPARWEDQAVLVANRI